MTSSPETTPLTPAEMALSNMQRGDASKGEMEVSDGETECAGCDAAVPKSAAIYWRCSSAMECDPYCTACARKKAKQMQMMCDAIEAGHDKALASAAEALTAACEAFIDFGERFRQRGAREWQARADQQAILCEIALSKVIAVQNTLKKKETESE